MPHAVVELHIPRPTDDPDPDEWAEEIESFLADLEEIGEIEVPADPETRAAVHVFYLTGPDPDMLLAACAQAAALPGVPRGAYAVVTAEPAPPRRVSLS
ncbi:hypothetical protein LO762_16085 [Actinocorallia sp. API 0066]|uniref:hypothetical protein n=1 Tax=Actinocorallia sp. API 0066 TaxID=2896846 RepID=UPI001E3B5F6D|nr:hypothetical protein [Actinocorallia sp. API 0066]MCD0450696.1 hypothetical protein [Actinocorallia sp. API 0066]